MTEQINLPTNDPAPKLPPLVNSTGEHLCVSCSLCCSGALFGKLSVTECEREVMKDDGEFFEEGGQLCLRLKCKSIGSNGYCQAYKKRPAGCAKYKCHQLKSVESGVKTYEAAMATIQEARRLNAECLEASRVACTDDYWNAELMQNAIQGILRVQLVAQSDIPVDPEALDAVLTTWNRYANFVCDHIVDHVERETFRTSLFLPGGPYDVAAEASAVPA